MATPDPRSPAHASATCPPLTRVTLAPAEVRALRRPGGSTRLTSLWPVDQTPRSSPVAGWTAQRARQAGALAATGLVLTPTLAAPASVFADGGTSVAPSTPAASTATPSSGPDSGAATTTTTAASAPTAPATLPAGPSTSSTPTPPAPAVGPGTATVTPGSTVSAKPQVSGHTGPPVGAVHVTVPSQATRPVTHRAPGAPRHVSSHPTAPHSAPPVVVGVPAAPPSAAPLPTAPAGTATPGTATVPPPAPLVAANLGAPAALSSAVTRTAFAALRLPLFLLPIYQAAGDRYGIPWQVLAAINEVETNYGFDDRTSSAGAIGWMQFEPSSWQGYGVDVAGQRTANPYNPADAIYAAAAYLKAAGGQTDVHGAIFAYNHSADYVQSVMLRAQLIESFPQAMINALSNLSVGRPPVPMSSSAQAALATTTAVRTPQAPAAAHRAKSASVPASSPSAIRNATLIPSAPPTPSAAARAHRAPGKPAPPVSREMRTRAHSPVVSVRDGRIVAVGHSHQVGDYVTVADVDGNRFTYSHLQRTGTPPISRSAAHAASASFVSAGASARPAASTAVPLPPAKWLQLLGYRPPLLRISPARAVPTPRPGQWAPLYRGELLSAGSVIGQVADIHGHGVLRFALRPAGSSQTVDPGPYLTAWNLREKVLAPARATADARAVHDAPAAAASPPAAAGASSTPGAPTTAGRHQLPGAPGQNAIPGQSATVAASAPAPSVGSPAATATPANSGLRQVRPRAGASDITTWGDESMFFQSKVTLSREVLSDRRISIPPNGRQDIAAHRIDRRVLAVLEYLADSGLHPTVSALQSGHGRLTTSGNVSEHSSGNAVDIADINGVNIIGHQGSGSITDITIQRLLALPAGFVPHQIISLMTYNQATNTLSLPDHFNHIHVGFHPAGNDPSPYSPSARIASAASSLSTTLNSHQWQQLTAHLESLGDPPLLLPGASASPQISPAGG